MNNTLSGLGLRVLFGNFAGTFASQITGALIQLATVSIIARVYGPIGNGSYAIALLLPGLIATFLNLGIGPANVYYLGSGKFRASQIFKTTLILASAFSLIGLAIGSYIILFVSEKWFPGIDSYLLWIALAAFPAILLQNFVTSIFQGLQRFKEFNFTQIAQPLVTMTLVLTVALLGSRKLEWLILAYLAGVFTTLGASCLLLKRRMPASTLDNSGPSLRYAPKAIHYGYKAHLSNILAFVNYRADIFLLNLLASPASAGIYVIAVSLCEKLWMLSESVSRVLLPRLSELSNDEKKRLQITPLITRLVLLVTALAAFLMSFIAYPTIYLLFGSLFLPAFMPLLILLPGIVAGSASRILANDLAARGKPELNMYTSVFVVTMNITGNIILIPLYGLNGAALATSMAYSLNFVLRIVMYRHISKNTVMSLLFFNKNDWNSIRRGIKGKDV